MNCEAYLEKIRTLRKELELVKLPYSNELYAQKVLPTIRGVNDYLKNECNEVTKWVQGHTLIMYLDALTVSLENCCLKKNNLSSLSKVPKSSTAL